MPGEPSGQNFRRKLEPGIFDGDKSDGFIRAPMGQCPRQVNQAHRQFNFSRLKKNFSCRVRGADIEEPQTVEEGRDDGVNGHRAVSGLPKGSFQGGSQLWFPSSQKPLQNPLGSPHSTDEENNQESEAPHGISITIRHFWLDVIPEVRSRGSIMAVNRTDGSPAPTARRGERRGMPLHAQRGRGASGRGG